MKTIAFIVAVLIGSAATAQPKISIDSAASHVNEIVMVCSKVYGVKSLDKVTLLNLGAAYPKSPLTVAIFAKDSANFKIPLANLENENVCITGKVKLYKGKPEIVVTNQSEIEFMPPPPPGKDD